MGSEVRQQEIERAIAVSRSGIQYRKRREFERLSHRTIPEHRRIADVMSDEQFYGSIADVDEPGLVQRFISDRDKYVSEFEKGIQRGNRQSFHAGWRGLKSGEVIIHADMMALKVPNPRPKGDDGNKGKRGVVRGMSRASRRRMFKRMATFRNIDEGILFLTLTYPDLFPEEWEKWKRDLKVFIQRLKRLYPEVSGLWRLELKRRKSGESEGKIAPHFHLLLFGFAGIDADTLDELRCWMSENWYQVVGSGDEKHLRAGTNLVLCRSRKHAMSYVSKYIAKVSEGEEDELHHQMQTGRVWGLFGNLDTSESLRAWLPPQGVAILKRYVAAWLRSKGQKEYAKRIKRGKLGFFILGLGDSSSPVRRDLDSVIMRLLDVVYDEAQATYAAL